MSFYLNPRIIEDLREAVIQSAYLQKEVDKFNLVCAVMDRLDSASRYLNDHSEYPKDESQYLAFMAYACMICDSHDALRLVVLGTKEKDETEKEADKEHKILGDIFMKEPFSLSEDAITGDNTLFKYVRAISFAHPYETSRYSFLKRTNLPHMSPMTIVANKFNPIADKPGCICIWIYQSDGKTLRLNIPWKSLLEYIQSRYDAISVKTDWIKDKLDAQIAEWKTHRIDRTGTVPEILQRIIDLIHERYELFPKTQEDDCLDSKAWTIHELLRDYTLKLSDLSNKTSVERYRKAISDAIPDLCDIIDDVGDWDEVSDRFLFAHPKTMHPGCDYELEKIHGMRSGDYQSTYRGRPLAADFAKGFAGKWVNIDAQNMPVEEIQLLANVACYLEAQEVGEKE